MKNKYASYSKSALIPAVLILLMLFTGLALPAQTSYIYLYSPYGGQVIYRNSAVDVNWYSSGADTVSLKYSLDNGSSWNTIADNFAGTYYLWTAPDTISDQCTLRITSATDTSVYAEAGPLMIREIPTLTLLSPNGGETWNYNEAATVTWSGSNLPYYLYLDYSTDGGQTWNQLGSGYSDSTGGSAQVYVPYVSSTNALVKVYDPYYPLAIADSSDQAFTIFTPPVIMYSPYEGDEFYIKEETYISWMATGIDFVNIELSGDGGQTWQPVAQNIEAANGYYIWTISGTPSDNCVLRVSDAADPSKSGISGTFSLLATPVITLNAPTGGEIINTNAPLTISWSYDNPAAYYLYLDYSINNGQDWTYIGYVMHTGTQGSFEWTTPAAESEQCLVRISDYNLGFVSDTSNVFSVLSYPSTPICMVTVDSATNRNVIVWEKPVSPLINKFIVYKESGVAGIYDPIGVLDYSELSAFADTNSNPAVKSYRYKLGFTDTAGHIFPASDLHQTIHLSINQGVGNSWNLIWTSYLGFNVGSYNIYRGTSPTDLAMVTSISASFNSYTDFDAPVGTVYYMIEVVNPGGCTPTLKSNTFSNSRSNIATNKSLAVTEQAGALQTSVFPNPANEQVTVAVAGAATYGALTITLTDILGQTLFSDSYEPTQLDHQQRINVSNLKEGIYLVVVSAGDRKIVKKIVVKH